MGLLKYISKKQLASFKIDLQHPTSNSYANIAEKPVKNQAEEVSDSKMAISGPKDIMDEKYQLLDVLRNAVRILADQWPFQLQQAFHELCFLPKNRTKCVYFALKSHFLTISGPRMSFPVKLPVTSGSVWDRCLESIRVPRCSGASELDKCAHVTFATQKKEA